ncbi:MAG: hypothetical protein GX591_16625 [Planctomycetes bacterium]|nr:hypothetical protein [Planctomycetota bacterium]
MAEPMFDGVILTTDAGRTILGCRRSRAYVETMPGVNGAYVQACGYGPRPLAAEGLLAAQGSTAASARGAVMELFRQRERLADGSTLATFAGTDGHLYANCLLQRYAHGPLRIARGGGTFTAYLPVRADLLQVTP